MGLASTFTNSIVREIGRNYGKSISNDLLGDSHSTPVRMVGGSSSIARKRGRKYGPPKFRTNGNQKQE